ncbi:hypothetical protein [Faecalibacillus intestinalis]|uniref:hypothetical protein n=1 Tax=Faecalibacillus intestinalis TaxID=1982626 RepID=UPI00352218ED
MYEKDNYNTFNIFNNHVYYLREAVMPEPVVEVVLVVVVEEVLQVLEAIAITTIIMEEEGVPIP